MDFWKNKKVFITGHTGFKGAWLSRILINAGSEVTGYSLESPTRPSLFQLADIDRDMNSVIADVRNLERLTKEMQEVRPDIVIHMAAQPIVRTSYEQPVYTYETNVMGTVNLLEAVRRSDTVRSLVNVTTDKVYENLERTKGYTEDEKLCGFDPYSNSKSCSDIITYSYRNSFFNNADSPAISTARSGNVIGGGDFAKDRIIPDCVKAVEEKRPIIVRNPHSIRPYQHVLESLFAYLMIAAKQYEDRRISDYYNVGPDDCDCITTGALVDLFCKKWGDEQIWENKSVDGPHEANYLKLDCSKLKNTFGWHPHWNIADSIDKTVDWTKTYLAKGDILAVMDKQIAEFLST
jgi:CDP-glucose 4,6-dehydratase